MSVLHPFVRIFPNRLPPWPKRQPGKALNKPAKLGDLPEWNLTDLYPGLDSPEVKRDLELADSECAAFEQDFKGRLAALAAGEGRRACESRGALRGDRRPAWPADVLCSADLCRQHHRSGARKILRRHAGAHHGGVAASPVLHARAQPHRRRAAGGRDARSRARPLPALDRGRAQGKALSARGPGRGAVPREVGDRLFGLEPAVRRDDGGLRFKVAGKTLAIEPTLNLLQDVDGKKRKAAAEALAKTFKENLRPFTLITNTLAKDKEISDRWRGFKDIADCAPPVEPGRARGGRGAGRGGARGLSAAVAPLLRAEGEVVRQEAAAALGSQRAAAEGGAADDRLGRRARRPCSRPMARFSPKMADVAEQFLHEALDRCAGAPGQAAGRLRASDGAVGASLCPAQLSWASRAT